MNRARTSVAVTVSGEKRASRVVFTWILGLRD